MSYESVLIGDRVLNHTEKLVVEAALDMYARFLLGQFTEIGHYLSLFRLGYTNEQVKKATQLLKEVQTVLHGHPHRSFRLDSNLIHKRAVRASIVEHLLRGETKEADKLKKLLIVKAHDEPEKERGGFSE